MHSIELLNNSSPSNTISVEKLPSAVFCLDKLSPIGVVLEGKCARYTLRGIAASLVHRVAIQGVHDVYLSFSLDEIVLVFSSH